MARDGFPHALAEWWRRRAHHRGETAHRVVRGEEQASWQPRAWKYLECGCPAATGCRGHGPRAGPSIGDSGG